MELTNACPPQIGAWNEDGTYFVVKSSQFADLLREQFHGTLQTFVRQLHFYSFNKKDYGNSGTWTFSHPSFLRGQPELLVNIERKSNPKRKSGKDDDDESGDKDSSPDNTSSALQAMEARMLNLERQLNRLPTMEMEIANLKTELVAFKELAAAQNLLSLAPGVGKKRVAKEDPSVSKEKSFDTSKEEITLANLGRPAKVTRMTSVDSLFELKDFPFEDTSSLGSLSVKDLMRELQYGIFSDFDEFLPSVARASVDISSLAPPTPLPSDPPVEGKTPCSKECTFSIPNGMQLEPGVTISLLKQAFNVIAKLCCPCPQAGITDEASCLKKLCDDLPPPNTLPPVELCEYSRSLLPILREHVEEEATDLALMKSARQVYEIYYMTVMKKLHDKKEGASRTPQATSSSSVQTEH